MKITQTLVLLIVVAGIGMLSVAQNARAQEDATLKRLSDERSFFEKQYKRGDKYVPQWGAFLGADKDQYEEGFNDGLTFAIRDFPLDGTATATLNMFKANQKKPTAYQMGFVASLEVYTAYQLAKRPGA